MKKSILFICIAVTHTLFSQEVTFEHLFQEDEYALSITEGPNEGFLIGGTIKFLDNPVEWGYAHATHFNAQGNIEWQQSYFQNENNYEEEKWFTFRKVLHHKSSNKWFGLTNRIFVSYIQGENINTQRGYPILSKHFNEGSMQWQKEVHDTLTTYTTNSTFEMIFSSDSNAIYLNILSNDGEIIKKYSLDGELLWENRNLNEHNLYADPYQQRFFVYGRHSNNEVIFHDINEESGALINSYITHGFDEIYDIKAREGGGYWCIGEEGIGSDLILAALGEQMDTLWTKSIQGPQHPISYQLNDFSEFFPNNNVHIVTCNQKYFTEPDRGLVIALDTNMDTLWTYQHFKGDTSSRIRDATRLKDGSVIVTGNYGIPNDFHHGSFVFKIGVDGSVGLSENMPFQDKAPYPNPTNSVLHTHNNTEKSIYNLQGQLLWQGKDKSIEVRHWQKGMYLLRTKDKTYRWMKQ